MEGISVRSVCLLLLSLGVCVAEIKVMVESSVEVIKGDSAKLPCTYTTSDSSAPIVVQWFVEDSSRKRIAYQSSKDSGVDKDTQFTGRASMEPDNTLTISHTDVNDEKSFYCQVSGGPVGVNESKTMLKIFFAPDNPIVAPNTQNIAVGEDIDGSYEVGTCTSRNGHPAPRIIWYNNSMPLPDVKDPKEKTYMVTRIVRESSGLLTVASILYMHLKKEDAKSVFHCKVEYTMPKKVIKEADSDKFNVTLHYPAEKAFFKLLNKSPVKEGDDVNMKCETDGNPQPLFEFYKNKTKIQQTETGLLTLEKVTRDNAGTYTCEAVDFDSRVNPEDLTKTLRFSVHYLDPVSIVPTGSITINKGAPLELQCKTKSSDQFLLVWKKDGNMLSQNGAFSQQSATLTDAGVYVCVASVPSVPGLEKSANITVHVSGMPEFDEPKKGEVSQVGDMVTLICSALGYPAPQFTWKPSGKTSVTINGQKTISTVTLKATEEVLRDGVTCEAINAHGRNSLKFVVERKSENDISGSPGRADAQQAGASGVVIAVVVCVLLLLLLVASLYFLSKNGKMPCGKKGKKEVDSGKEKNGSQNERENLKSPEKMEDGTS